jgi:hypothetical protein
VHFRELSRGLADDRAVDAEAAVPAAQRLAAQLEHDSPVLEVRV